MIKRKCRFALKEVGITKIFKKMKRLMKVFKLNVVATATNIKGQKSNGKKDGNPSFKYFYADHGSYHDVF